jgi:hypothetical protein
MPRHDKGTADLAPRPLHRADVELMLASLIAQLFTQSRHGELRFVADDAPPGAGRWSLRAPRGGWHDVRPECVRQEVRHLLDGLASQR